MRIQELAEIEAQLDNLMKENQSLKSESSDAKTTILNLKKQLAQADEMHNNFKEKYLKAKNANKSLKSHLETVTRLTSRTRCRAHHPSQPHWVSVPSCPLQF